MIRGSINICARLSIWKMPSVFETAEAGILKEMCEDGYFDYGRTEDEVAYLLDDWDFETLTEEQRRFYDERIYPLMRIWAFERIDQPRRGSSRLSSKQ